MSGSGAESPQSHLTLKDFLASIISIKGDLSNITAPPFVLDTKSTVELPAFWAERPSLFVAPASEPGPARRALLVLRWFLASLKNQQYAGRSEEQGVRKPLNAILGECFLAKWEDDSGETRLVSEQVSHHPPVTACRLWNDTHGVSAEGFTRQEITLALGNISIKQMGHALLTLKGHENETYLIPLPDVKVKGILSGLSGTYPELDGTYTIASTSGYRSVIEFDGKSLLGSGEKNSFTAKLFGPRQDWMTEEGDALYTVVGRWNKSFTIYKGPEISEDAITETIVLADLPTVPLKLLDEDQDPWESRRAWGAVREALQRGDMAGTAEAKSVIEQGQRQMRKDEARDGKKWQPLFFKAQKDDKAAAELYKSVGKELKPEDTVAIWKFDQDTWQKNIKRPFHGSLTPDNKNTQGNSQPKVPAGGLSGAVTGRGGLSVWTLLDNGDDFASPASFKTADEFFPDSTPNGTEKAQKNDHQGSDQKPATKSAVTAVKAAQATTPRQSVENGRNGRIALSDASISSSTRRGKRQRARESIGKFRSSLSAGLSKLGSPGRES